MRTLFLVLFTGLYIASYAQCTKEKDGTNNKDFINTDKLKMGTTVKMRGKVLRFLNVRMEYEDKVTTIFLYPQFDDKVMINEADIIYVKFEDESVLQLKAANSSTARYSDGISMKQGNSGNVWYNTVKITPTDDQLKTLKSKKIVKVRSHDTDYLAKDDEQTVISDLLKCIDSKK